MLEYVMLNLENKWYNRQGFDRLGAAWGTLHATQLSLFYLIGMQGNTRRSILFIYLQSSLEISTKKRD